MDRKIQKHSIFEFSNFNDNSNGLWVIENNNGTYAKWQLLEGCFVWEQRLKKAEGFETKEMCCSMIRCYNLQNCFPRKIK